MRKRQDAAMKLRPIYQKGAQTLPNADALKAKGIYEQWKNLIGVKVKKGYIFAYGDELYRTEQPEYTFVEHYVPGVTGTESLFSHIDKEHAGTFDDPVPAKRSMVYVYGLHYLDPDDNLIYLCKREGEAEGGEITLHYLPHELIGQYFVEATANG